MTQPDLSDLSDLKILRLRKGITDTIFSTLGWQYHSYMLDLAY